MKNVTGVKNICFVYNGSFEFDYWQAAAEGGSSNAGSSIGNTGTSQGQTAEANLLNTYGTQFGYSGTCINLYQLRDASQLQFLKTHYNSITLENEMKPDALLGGSARLITVNEAKNRGYYIPDSYKEQYVPQINFSTVDEVMKICYQNGLKMRAHTLVWHSQTPGWFFRNGYAGNGGFVNQQTMDARLEMYVKTVMNHVYLSEYGSVVYAWDVANEILHAQNSGWEAVYGNNRTNASYVKKAFNYAYDTLEYFKLTDSVKLFYNDYNTYMEVDDVIKLVNYINQGRKVCAGVGMQSHLGTGFPSVDYYTTALRSFINSGFEVQITEIDITNKGDNDLATYAYNLFKNINSLKKNGGNITSVTWWGLSDQTTWIDNAAPLLFSRPGAPKTAYSKVIQANVEVFGQPTSGPQNQPVNPNPSQGSQGSQESNTQAEPVNENVNENVNARIEDGWYYVKNPSSQKYLTVEGNSVSTWANVCISTGTGVDGQKWYVTNSSDGTVTLTSALGSFMLDVADGADEDGANLGIYQAYGGSAQQFVVKTTANESYYTIATKCSKETKYLDIYQKKTDDGTNVVQWKYNGGNNQLWQFEKTEFGGGQSDPSKEENPQVEPQPQPQPQPENDPEPVVTDTGMNLEYFVNSWGSGYQISFKVINNTGNAVNTWTLKLNKNDVNISSSWNVNISEEGDYYVIRPVDWNSYIADGQSIEFGALGDGQASENIEYSFE
ncbi:MAG: endo-1,4-beta-xylanase [Butyrivibrio sp.]|nr:endo-1,4-beta-xylanase [Butyrivibrio sp.]